MKMLISLLFISSFYASWSLAAPGGAVAISEAQKSKLMGFKEWKKLRVLEATLALDELSKDATVEPELSPGSGQQAPSSGELGSSSGAGQPIAADSGSEKKSPQNAENTNKKENQQAGASPKETQLRFNLEIAQNLTIHDYFAIYLKDKSKEEMIFVIGQLSSDELTELLSSYRDSLYGAPQAASTEPTKNQQN